MTEENWGMKGYKVMYQRWGWKLSNQIYILIPKHKTHLAFLHLFTLEISFLEYASRIRNLNIMIYKTQNYDIDVLTK